MESTYKLRWDQIQAVYNLPNETHTSRWWKLNELLDDWEDEDFDPRIPPPKKLKWGIPVEQFGLPFHTVCDQSPPPGHGNAAASSALPSPASSAALPPPATPPELLDPRFKNMQEAMAGFVGNGLEPSYLLLVAKNKAAALAVRDRKLAEERAAKEAEALQLSQLG